MGQQNNGHGELTRTLNNRNKHGDTHKDNDETNGTVEHHRKANRIESSTPRALPSSLFPLPLPLPFRSSIQPFTSRHAVVDNNHGDLGTEPGLYFRKQQTRRCSGASWRSSDRLFVWFHTGSGARIDRIFLWWYTSRGTPTGWWWSVWVVTRTGSFR